MRVIFRAWWRNSGGIRSGHRLRFDGLTLDGSGRLISRNFVDAGRRVGALLSGVPIRGASGSAGLDAAIVSRSRRTCTSTVARRPDVVHLPPESRAGLGGLNR